MAVRRQRAAVHHSPFCGVDLEWHDCLHAQDERAQLPRMSEDKRAHEQAAIQLEGIHELLHTYDNARLAGSNEDDAREEIQESILSVSVRSGWHAPGDYPDDAGEYQLFLCWGGPACRIIGALGDDGAAEVDGE